MKAVLLGFALLVITAGLVVLWTNRECDKCTTDCCPKTKNCSCLHTHACTCDPTQ